MKKLLIVIIMAMLCQMLFSQEDRFEGMHGLYNMKNKLYLSYQSYSIYISSHKGKLGEEKTLKAIKKDLNLNDTDILAIYKEPAIGSDNIVIEAVQEDKDKPEVKGAVACYIFPAKDSGVRYIYFYTLNQRDVVAEHDIVNQYLLDGLESYIGNSNNAEKINFVGREIILGNACGWRGPNNVFCKGGQISWSEFPSYDQAVVDLQLRILSNQTEHRKALSDEDIEVIFEDIPTVARRIVYNDPYSNYPLAVYYIAQEVRGRAVSCIMSNYVYNTRDYELSALLQQFMSIPVLPDDAYNEFDYPVLEGTRSGGLWYKTSDVPSFEVRAGTWLPIGNLQDVYKVAPSAAFYWGMPVYRNLAVDIGFNMVFPINSGYFDYYDHGLVYRAKARPLIGLSFRGRYQYTMTRNVYLTPYIGMGVHTMTTNLKKEYIDDDDENEYYDVSTIDVFGGAMLRYRKVGIFFEYHYTPYSIAGKVRERMGNSALNLGISVAF